VKLDIKGIDKGTLLAALYNRTHALGLGAMHDRGPLTAAEGKEIFEGRETKSGTTRFPDGYLDYVRGRPIKADLTGDEFDPFLYDRDAGQGVAAEVIAAIRGAK